MTEPPAKFCGLDFGTSNSTVTVLNEAGAPRLPTFGRAGAETFPSVLFFGRQSVNGIAEIVCEAGHSAIDRYSEAGRSGRLLRSMKAFLADSNFSSTNIYGKPYTLPELIALFIKRLFEAANESIRLAPSMLVVGRPVHFSTPADEAVDSFAMSRLREAMTQCGFDDIVFEYEPVAAAYSYEQRLSTEKLVMVGDFGGGTSDFCVLQAGPGARARTAGDRAIIGTDGVPIAGDAFDRQIIKNLVAPALGYGSDYVGETGKRLPVPNWPYAALERWHVLSTVNRRNIVQIMERIADAASDSPAIRAFCHFIMNDLGHELHHAVRNFKTTLSREPVATFRFSIGPVFIERVVSRDQFEGWIKKELEAIAATVDRLLLRTGVQPHDIDHVFLTGGSAFVPAVRRIFLERFGERSVAGGEEFTAVATGLALRGAHELRCR